MAPSEIMELPVSRRKRLAFKKEELLIKQKQQNEQLNKTPRRR